VTNTTTRDAFTARTFHNRYLAGGTGMVDAVVTVTASGEHLAAERSGAGPAERAEIVIIDTSGSMSQGRKLRAAQEAARAALDVMDDGTAFAVIAGDSRAQLVWPADGRALAVISPRERAAAGLAIDGLVARYTTVISTWIDLARDLFATSPAAARHAILLTDGFNDVADHDNLAAAVEASRGVFQCDCRGVGIDWAVAELRPIATALLGTVDLIADADGLADAFRAIVASSQSRTVPDVALRLWAPQGAVIDTMRQATPELVDLTANAASPGPRVRDYGLGGWAPGESRDYHVRIRVEPGKVGDKMLAGRVSIVVADAVATETKIEVEWTSDAARATRIDPHVATVTGQKEMADAIDEGLAAANRGDTQTATVRLGDALQLARKAGRDDLEDRLGKVVEIDARTGTVRLRPDANKEDITRLDINSRRTVRTHPSVDEEPAGGRQRA
jgi:von Willebrand factor type A C-terminal domain/von Willebrand factor type A domain